MALFFEPIPTLERLNARSKDTMAAWIGIEYCEIGADYLVAKMPADHRTYQPMQLINGGAFCTLAETVGSMAANLCINRTEKVAVGLDINANHVGNISNGFVYGKAKALHIGNTTQVWEINITNEAGKLVCISRLTVAVIARKK